jgi:hypothetical protein
MTLIELTLITMANVLISIFIIVNSRLSVTLRKMLPESYCEHIVRKYHLKKIN